MIYIYNVNILSNRMTSVTRAVSTLAGSSASIKLIRNEGVLFSQRQLYPCADRLRIQGLSHQRMGRPEFTNGSTSVGIVYKRNQLGSIIQVRRIEGELFESKEQAEQHGVKLCTEWIDKQRGRV